ncbi:MAG: STAS domain-containing protein [candidate division KSB1 bacterium]|nr:STAS domain-containing protein [candidate division KSB1 bacterium]MDZ7274465.1 STAS domain-containing protein [candidate division KSB1 bacterium]MDZ7284873.1 STAS domain-containing protein [candidate division KSB1 bacterium]MDZ7297706.1 STAS domain-containing protein [candidate division KSB1 bacterium]MDZ7308276.1 STAS domain-containing protein [candidate division KSB1 bacterium]
MEGIQVSVEKTGVNNNIAVIKVGGYIDTTTSAELEHALEGLLKNGMNDIIIDLGNVDYISSAGWGIFISEIKGIREKGGDLKLVRMIPDVYEVFELLEFHYILKAFDTIEEAVNDFDRNSSLPRKTPPRPAPKAAPADNGGVMVTDAPSAMVMDQPAPAKSRSGGRSVDDYIREIIAEQPEAGTFKIKQMLSTPRFGMHRLSWFEVRRRLKDLGLDSKQKRLDFLRQRAV